MADIAKIFNGLRFVSTLPEVRESNVIYFVRTNESKTDGYLFFNGKKYGTGEDAKAALIEKYGELSGQTISEYVADQIETVISDANALTDRVTKNEQAIKTINGEGEGSIKKAVADVVGNDGDASTTATIKGAQKAAAEAKAAADAAKTTADGKVASVTAKAGETAIVVDNTTTTAPTIALKLAETQGNVVLSQENGLKAKIDLSAFGVKGVAGGEKVISVSAEGLLSSTLSLKYDSATKKINLYGNGKAEDETNLISSIDATAFIKDGMLDGSALYTATAETGTVTINNKEYRLTGLIANHAYIVLVWNTDAAKNAMAIDVTSLIDTYTAGNGLSLDGHKFSVDTTKIATVELVNGVTTKVQTLEGKVGSAAGEGEGGPEATGLFKAVADNKAAIDKLNGDVNVPGSVDKKIKDALEAGAVTLQVKDTDAYLGVTSATTDNGGTVYTLASKEAEIKKAIKTAADAVKVSVNGGTYVTGSVDEAGRAITLSETVQKVETSSASAKGLAEASDVKDYVDRKVGDKNVSAEGDAYVSASADANKVTVAATADLKNAVTNANSAVQSVNGVSATAVTLDATNIEVGAEVGGKPATAKVNAVLADIYAQLGKAVKADGETIKEDADTHKLSVNLEATSDDLVKAGHIEIKKNTAGALYGVMYCLGDDAE